MANIATNDVPQSNTITAIPTRPFGSIYSNDRLPPNVPILALGCSSFSTFFQKLSDQQHNNDDSCCNEGLTIDHLYSDHPKVQSWIDTIIYAITVAGITMLDTAPWYGHGTSEVVIGYAFEKLFNEQTTIRREQITINTKIGRYEADPKHQFDYTYNTTIKSVERSLQRMFGGINSCTKSSIMYVDVLQLHDPEFVPDIQLLFTETIPAMLYCQSIQQWCRAIGMTGYPLSVQHQILERSYEVYGKNIWDQALTYSHYNLHDTSLVQPNLISLSKQGEMKRTLSFIQYCQQHAICVVAAAPLSMGLLTTQGPPDWHPSSIELQVACRHANTICIQYNMNLSTMALLFALSNPDIPTTILGMSTIEEVKMAHSIAARFNNIDIDIDKKPSSTTLTQDEIMDRILSEEEKFVMNLLRDPIQGPFANIWSSSKLNNANDNDNSNNTILYQWDGIQIARDFWKLVPDQNVVHWQQR